MKFTKMHGLGNDFMVIDAINQKVQLTAQRIASLADRHKGVGFDQCLLIEASKTPGVDFSYRIFNADGQEVGQCGNGARCLALFAKHYGLTTKCDLSVATKTTRMNLKINPDHTVTVDMGIPQLAPPQIPFLWKQQEAKYAIELGNGNTAHIHAISVGNPHAVVVVSDIQSAPINEWGPQISLHPLFPEQTNTGFMQIINPNEINLRVYERGCGETQACGSGAVAAAAIGRLYHQLAEKVIVHLPGGSLIVEWPSTNAPIRLTGPAHFVYEATLISQHPSQI